MQTVIQQHPKGCAIAAAAAIANCSYQKASDIAANLDVIAGDKKLWSSTQPIRSLLAHWQIAAGPEQDFTGWDHLPNCALLAIKWREVNGVAFWHWVVFYRDATYPKGLVLDSKKALKNHRRQDFGRMQPKWFIAVARPA